MKKLLLSMAILLGIFTASTTFAEGTCCNWPSFSSDPNIEFRAGYFTFYDSHMSKVYRNGGYDLQIASSIPVSTWFDLYGSLGYTHASGKALGTGRKARFTMYPLSLGVKPTFCIFNNLKGYFTVGPRYFFVHTSNHSPYVKKHLNQNGCGFFANAGLQLTLCDGFFLDTFWEYSYKKMHFHTSRRNVYTREVQVGGYTFGLGLGYNF